MSTTKTSSLSQQKNGTNNPKKGLIAKDVKNDKPKEATNTNSSKDKVNENRTQERCDDDDEESKPLPPSPAFLAEKQEAYRAKTKGKGTKKKSGGGKDLPPVRPPVTSKREVCERVDLAKVDEHVFQTPKDVYRGSLDSLVERLTGKWKKNDVAKARALFRWLAAQPIALVQKPAKPPPEDSVLASLLQLKNGEMTYAHFYSTLCSLAELPCQVIPGYLKGAKYSPGQDVDASLLSHWVAVALDGEWRLIDPLWGSRRLTLTAEEEWMLVVEGDDEEDGRAEAGDGEDGQMKPTDKQPQKQDSSKKDDNSKKDNVDDIAVPYMVSYQCNEFYFMTDPEAFIFSHFPVETRWQLLADEISLEQYTQMSYVTSMFFDLKCLILSDSPCKVHTGNGQLQMKFGSSDERCLFEYCLYFEGKNADFPCDRYVIMDETSWPTVAFKFKLPVEGRFKFELFGVDKAVDEENSNNNNNQEVKQKSATGDECQGEFQLITAFLIEFKKEPEEEQKEEKKDKEDEKQNPAVNEVTDEKEPHEDGDNPNSKGKSPKDETNPQTNNEDKEDKPTQVPSPNSSTSTLQSDPEEDRSKKPKPELKAESTMTEPWDSDEEETNVQVAATVHKGTQNESRRKKKGQKKKEGDDNKPKENKKEEEEGNDNKPKKKEQKKKEEDETHDKKPTNKGKKKEDEEEGNDKKPNESDQTKGKTKSKQKDKQPVTSGKNGEKDTDKKKEKDTDKKKEEDTDKKKEENTDKKKEEEEGHDKSDDEVPDKTKSKPMSDQAKQKDKKKIPDGEKKVNSDKQTKDKPPESKSAPSNKPSSKNPAKDEHKNSPERKEQVVHQNGKRKKSVHFYDEASMDSGRGSEDEGNTSLEPKPDDPNILVIPQSPNTDPDQASLNSDHREDDKVANGKPPTDKESDRPIDNQQPSKNSNSNGATPNELLSPRSNDKNNGAVPKTLSPRPAKTSTNPKNQRTTRPTSSKSPKGKAASQNRNRKSVDKHRYEVKQHAVLSKQGKPRKITSQSSSRKSTPQGTPRSKHGRRKPDRSQAVDDADLLHAVREAIRRGDREDLERAIQACRERGVTDTHGLLEKAEKELDVCAAREDLEKAVAGKNIKDLRAAIRNVQKKKYERRMKPEYDEAVEALASEERLQRLQWEVLKVDSSEWSEIRRYTNPHPAVHKTVQAALLLLGDHEARTKHWVKCQSLLGTLGPQGLFKRIMRCRPDELHPEVVARAEQFLNDLSPGEVHDVSIATHVFYSWAVGLVKEFHKAEEENDDDPDDSSGKRKDKDKKKEVKAANIPRQIEIFSQLGYDVDYEVPETRAKSSVGRPMTPSWNGALMSLPYNCPAVKAPMWTPAARRRAADNAEPHHLPPERTFHSSSNSKPQRNNSHNSHQAQGPSRPVTRDRGHAQNAPPKRPVTVPTTSVSGPLESRPPRHQNQASRPKTQGGAHPQRRPQTQGGARDHSQRRSDTQGGANPQRPQTQGGGGSHTPRRPDTQGGGESKDTRNSSGQFNEKRRLSREQLPARKIAKTAWNDDTKYEGSKQEGKNSPHLPAL